VFKIPALVPGNISTQAKPVLVASGIEKMSMGLQGQGFTKPINNVHNIQNYMSPLMGQNGQNFLHTSQSMNPQGLKMLHQQQYHN
jgi:hypothetical protein